MAVVSTLRILAFQFAGAFLAGPGGTRSALAEQKTALVIGVSAYPTAPLRNPVNDATAIADKLRSLGFDVTLKTNVSQREMTRAFSQFGQKLAPGSVALFYFAGHGIQVQGRNFLVPVDAEINTEASARSEAVDVDLMLHQLGTARLSIVILDACRNNPFERRVRGPVGGLAQMDAPTGTLIAYATAPGRTADDGPGANGLYTTELLRAIDIAGLSVEDVFKQVRVNVLKASANQQIPWEASSLTGEFSFRPATKTLAGDSEGQKQRAELMKSLDDERHRREAEAESLKRELEKLRLDLGILRAKLVSDASSAGSATAPKPVEQPTVAAKQAASKEKPAEQPTKIAAAPVTSAAAAAPNDWQERLALLERSRGTLSLSKALAITLDVSTDGELNQLLDYERLLKRDEWPSAVAMGVHKSGYVSWWRSYGKYFFGIDKFAAEWVLEKCKGATGGAPCRVVLVNGRLQEDEFAAFTRELAAGRRKPAELRPAFLKTLPK